MGYVSWSWSSLEIEDLSFLLRDGGFLGATEVCRLRMVSIEVFVEGLRGQMVVLKTALELH